LKKYSEKCTRNLPSDITISKFLIISNFHPTTILP
jgi:hypothetical protein